MPKKECQWLSGTFVTAFVQRGIIIGYFVLKFSSIRRESCNTIILGRDVRQEFRQKMHTLYEGDWCDNDDKRELKLKYFLSVLTYRATYVLQINLIYKIISYQIMHGITSIWEKCDDMCYL